MDPASWPAVDRVLQHAAALPVADRTTFLDSECAGQPELRAEVDSLLAALAASDDPLRRAIQQAAGALPSLATHDGRRIGPWRMERLIAHGGMGDVYLASREGSGYDQRAALKLVPRGFDGHDETVRFRLERQILAGLDHPGIARLLDGGETDDGVPYLVMEYVDGEPVTRYAERARPSLDARLRLFDRICDAVAYAHRHLIVHRDLKPSNVLVTAEGEPKLLDFGIAKLLDPIARPGATLGAERLYTPEYASPEQVRGLSVSTSTDIYGLGLLLFELLTGTKAQPLATPSAEELVHVVCERDPQFPAAFDRDLAAIVRMAVAKESSGRYSSVEQLQEDLGRYRRREPLQARPATLGYRAAKFARRNRGPLAAAAVLIVVVAAGIGATVHQARRAERRFSQVRSLARTVLFDLDAEIQRLPGSTTAREKLVSTALAYLDNLAQDTADDPALQLELAAAYERVGDVLGDPFSANLGQTQRALDNYSKALTLETRLAGRTANDPAILKAVSMGSFKVADLLARTERKPQAIEKYTEGLAAADRLAQMSGHSKAAHVLLHRGRLRVGDLELYDGHPAAALKYYQDALAVAEEAGTQTLARARLGDVYQELGRLEDALASYREVLKFREAAGAGTAAARRNLMLAHHYMGNVLGNPFYLNLLRPAEAEPHYRKALDLAEATFAADASNVLGRVDIATSAWRLGAVVALNRPPDAAAHHRRAIEMLRQVLASSPENTAYRRMQVFNYAGLGDALRSVGDHRGAYAALTAALDLSRASGDALNHDLPIVRIALGRVAMKRGDRAEADVQFQAALAIAEPSAKDHSEDLSCHRYLADCYQALAELHPDQPYRQKARAVWEGWLKRGVDNPFLRAQLALIRPD